MVAPRRIIFSIALWGLMSMACGSPRPWTPPETPTAAPPLRIYHRTPEGLVACTLRLPNHCARCSAFPATGTTAAGFASGNAEIPSRDSLRFRFEGDSRLKALSWAGGLDGPARPVESPDVARQRYYVRPEHTSTGYVRGHYRREGDFIRGEHTPGGYVPGSYLGSGDYVRGQHTPSGYIRGHYRSVAQPSGVRP